MPHSCGVARRDTAAIRLVIDTGMRRSAFAYLKLAAVHPGNDVTYVMGKGRCRWTSPFGRKTPLTLDRYRWVRGKHRLADSEMLWLGPQGPLGDMAVDLMLRHGTRRAGFKVHAHVFRHGFADTWLASGGQE